MRSTSTVRHSFFGARIHKCLRLRLRQPNISTQTTEATLKSSMRSQQHTYAHTSGFPFDDSFLRFSIVAAAADVQMYFELTSITSSVFAEKERDGEEYAWEWLRNLCDHFRGAVHFRSVFEFRWGNWEFSF